MQKIKLKPTILDRVMEFIGKTPKPERNIEKLFDKALVQELLDYNPPPLDLEYIFKRYNPLFEDILKTQQDGISRNCRYGEVYVSIELFRKSEDKEGGVTIRIGREINRYRLHTLITLVELNDSVKLEIIKEIISYKKKLK